MSNPEINEIFGNNTGAEPGIKMEPALIDKPPVRKVELDTAEVDKGPMVLIILEKNENIPPTGQFFGANGMGTMLRPGVEAWVKPSIINILESAVMSTPVVDPNTLQITGYEDRLRFPFRIRGHKPGAAAA